MTNKSGFEIRAGLLVQAQSLLENNITRKNFGIESKNTSTGTDDPLIREEISVADVIAAAKALYEFVNDKQCDTKT